MAAVTSPLQDMITRVVSELVNQVLQFTTKQLQALFAVLLHTY
jgi:hypothetical protein